MTQYREILRLHSQGISQRSIARSCQCSRDRVSQVITKAATSEICWPLDPKITDPDLEQSLFPKNISRKSSRRYPDYAYIDKEMMRNGVTLKLLWKEFCEECHQAQALPLMYSQFCFHYREFVEKKRATMHIPRKPGEQIEVDWAGNPARVVDRDTGEFIPAYIFVGVLPFSMYAYAEAFPSTDMESWITAHNHMYRFFGGAARMLIPDNLKTGVDRSNWYTPQINRTYHELAEHFNTAVIPARVRKPKDKPSVEGTVGNLSTWITAVLRNQKFFSFTELNKEIRLRLDAFNQKPFQKRESCRLSVFLDEEKSFLLPLPAKPYELAQWKQSTVQANYHIAIEKRFYSVPYEYIKQKVDVRVTKDMIEVFYHDNRICSHRRLHGRIGQYSTVEAHMPEDHQKYFNWNKENFINWAEKIGTHTATAVKSILNSFKVEQQGYKSCMGLLKLADKYSLVRLEDACEKALTYTPRPSYKMIHNILVTGQDKTPTPTKTKESAATEESYAFVRGAAYYGGKHHDDK